MTQIMVDAIDKMIFIEMKGAYDPAELFETFNHILREINFVTNDAMINTRKRMVIGFDKSQIWINEWLFKAITQDTDSETDFYIDDDGELEISDRRYLYGYFAKG